jgi:hypothetical protein
MKITENQKYRVLIQCHHFLSENEQDEAGFVLFPKEEYIVEYVYEKKWICVR